MLTTGNGTPIPIDPLLMKFQVAEQHQTRNGSIFTNVYKYYNLTTCTEEKFPGYDEVSMDQLYAESALCPDNYDFEMFGDYGSQELRGLSITLDKCDGALCANNNTMNAYLSDAR
jgi:hypothetical protein